MESGNHVDEADFVQREKRLEDDDDDAFSAMSMASALVDRENELSSRSNYYRQNAREHFEGHWHQLVEADPWTERDVETFLYLVRKGEEHRRWVLDSYEFEDPCKGKFDEEVVDEFEARAYELVKETYNLRGWNHSSDAGVLDGVIAAQDDDEDSDEEFFEDDEL